MQAISSRNQLFIGLGLAALMALTRSHHFAGLHHLPEASWAVFFLAGVYLSRGWVFPVLCLEAAVVDYLAIVYGGTSGFCVSPAYAMLVPAYGALWLAGRWYARHHREAVATLMPLAGSMLVGAVLAELFSSGGFYLFSGYFAAPSLAEFAARVARYFPAYLGALALYVGIAALAHGLLIGRGRTMSGHTAQ
ncbi:hypothetical protein EDC61_101168 [Sulfuritortus calidifontis]|uniref:Cobalamin ABC transporter n=1 Tax=Sulfuritortus calidifontis TaxID=1914471 RepID=A0A4R3K128_9PROT|nr:hypothetical protein [Sulfuritortus calidifontis]TCS73946.1 hypothetical protein EDC61_101168 [Sulfuritortus calidifontis]